MGNNGDDEINSVATTSDGGIIVVGYFDSHSITVGDYTLTNAGGSDGMVIKYDKDGEVEWATSIGGDDDDEINSVATTSDGVYIVGGNFYSDSITLGDYTLINAGRNDGIVITYNADGEVLWATSIGEDGHDQIDSVVISNDGKILVGGSFSSSEIVLDEDYTLTNAYAGNDDGMVIKYGTDGKVTWATSVGGTMSDAIISVAATNDGGVLVGGDFQRNIKVGDYALESDGWPDGMVIKYEEITNDAISITDARTVGGTGEDVISAIAKTSDGGYVAGGRYSGTLRVGEYEVTSQGSTDGILIKYDAFNNVEWAKTFGGSGAEEINKIKETDDEGFIVVGNFESSGLVLGNEIYENYGETDGLVIKYDKNGNIEWSSNIAGNYIDDLSGVVEANDGSYIAVGNIGSISNPDNYELGTNEFVIDNERITATTNPSGSIVIRYGLNGEVKWYGQHSGQLSAHALDIVMLDDGSYIVGGYFQSQMFIEGQRIQATSKSIMDGYIAKYNSDDTLAWVKNYGTSLSQIFIETLAKMEDDSIIVSGYFSKDITIGSYNLVNAGNDDSMLFKINKDGEITWATSLGGTEDDIIYKVMPTSDGGFIVAGSFDSDSITAGGYTVTKGRSMSGIAIKYDSEQNVEWAIGIPGNNSTYINAVESISDTKYLLGGYFSGSLVAGENNISSNGGNDGAIIEIESKVGVPEVQELSITNQKQEFEITTEAHGSGTVSGTDMSPYETVKYGEDSTQSIVIRPNSYNEIASITVNGEPYAFTPSYDGTYTMPLFTDVKEDIHVVVNFVYTYNKYTIHKVDEYTGEPVAGAKFRIESSYDTKEVTTDTNGQAVVELIYGRYTITEIETPEGYQQNDTATEINFQSWTSNEVTITNKPIAKVTVHHYLKDDSGRYTTTKVAEDDVLTGSEGDTYTATPHLDLAEYELEKDSNGAYVLPDDSTGTYTSAPQEVTFYYETKSIPLTVHHYIEGTQEQVELRDGTKAEDEIYSGKEGNSYSTDALTAQELSDKYELAETPANASGTYELPEVEVTYFYKVKQVQVTTKVEGEGGSISGQNETPYEEVEYGGDSTKDIIATPEEGYQVSKITVNGEPIEFEEEPDRTVILDKFIDMIEDKEVVVTFEQIPAQVIIHHYIEGTTDKVPAQNGGVVENETRSGHVGDMYATQASSNIAPNYEYVSSTDNTSGLMTEDTIEVIYYYRIKQAGIEQTITKEGTLDTITQEDEQVIYNITYTGTITDYIGNATVTIVDTLPFSIDTTAGKSDLNGGLYNDAENTITWTENISDIDTFTDPTTGQISITKQITVTYTNMDYSKTTFENKVEASIELEATSQEEGPVEDTVTTNTDFRTQVTVTKVWNHTNNIYGVPTQVELQVKNGNNVVARQVVNSSNKVGDDENTWSYTFTGLPKYDSQGQEINYTVDEAEVNPGDLAYYDKQISGNTITNTYDGPIISGEKTATTENNLNYVLENETITYAITVKNDGGVSKDVQIRDTIPTGTSFVENSIKINNQEQTYTQTELQNGITVNVPEHGQTTISFDVTVNELTENTFTGTIKNTAYVDGEPTEEITNTVNKPNVEAHKTASPADGNVIAGQEITYTIRLDNSTGTAPATVNVKDTIPEGTTFVEGSIKVGDTTTGNTADNLANGINVDVPANEIKTLEFKVKVNDLSNNTQIRNIATVDDEPTNETTHTYVEPIISQEKESETANGLDYAVEGEKITYTITVKNDGGLADDVQIQDNIPEGTSFVDGSIKISNNPDTANLGQTDLRDGK